MLKLFLRSALVAGLVALCVTPTLAQGRDRDRDRDRDRSCKGEVSATGSSSLTLKGAQDSAIKAWQRSVVLRYGELYSVWDQSTDKSVDRCGKTTFGLNRCDARGRPCQASEPGRSREISCGRDDSKDCSPTVKWIQTRLNTLDNAGLSADGGEGRNTERAIRNFKRKNGLGDSANVDDALLDALAK